MNFLLMHSTVVRLKSRQKLKMRTKAPQEKRNQNMTLSDRKHFAAMIQSGAKYKEVLAEHLRMFNATISRRTYQRIKRDSESILACNSHRLKTASYRTKGQHGDEKESFELHCKQVILDCKRRNLILNVPTIQQVLLNEASKFDYDWLKKVQFSNRYIERFMREHELVLTSKNSQQTHDSVDQIIEIVDQ